ncbi:MAG: hypothetical protein ACRC3J_03410 [Culicoidibacterales bacterium]
MAKLLVVMLTSLSAFQGSLFNAFLFTGKMQGFIDVPEIKARNVLNTVASEY